ncbi:hypothetical protein P3S67_002818 [Capsicum chacoense]
MRGVTYADECNTKRSLTGIWRQKNGRYAAVLTDRITRKKLWLGTFDAIKQASQACFSNKSDGKTGRYAADITDRIRHTRVWLGTFDTVEEASQAYFNKKLELENEILNQQGNHIQQSVADVETFDTASVVMRNDGIEKEPESSKEDSCLMADVQGTESTNERNVTASSLPTAKRCLNGIRRQQNGRYGAVITDQIRRKQVRLGTFDTVEEASQAYFSKKRRKSGRYSTKITDPIKQKEVYFGTFDTIEQASQAYFNKKSEFEKLRQQGQTENIRKRNCDQIQQPESPTVVASLDTAASARGRDKRTDSHITTPHMIGAYKSKTAGRYTSEIIHPITKKKIWLGTFGTAEEASHSFQSKKLEFQKLVKAKKQKCTQSKSEKLVNFKQGTAEEIFHVNQSKKFDLQSSKEVELQSDIPTDSSAGKKQEGQEDDEDLWMGKWVQLPGDREVMFSLDLY